MQRFTLLLLALMAIHTFCLAQVGLPSQNVFVKNSLTGVVTEIQPYVNGLVYLGNDGSDDVIVYSPDGETWSTAESLEAASASKLVGWQGADMAFYYGNNVSETEGLDIRLLNDGSASVFWSGGHASYGTEARTNVIRHNYGGSTAMRYYYLARTTDDMPARGYNAIVYESDGTDLGTYEVTHNVGFGKAVKMTNQTNDGELESCVFDGKVHIMAGMESTMGTYSSVFAINYNAAGSDISLLAQSNNESYSWVHMTATTDYIYTLNTSGGDEPGPLTAIAVDGTYTAVNNGSPLSFKIAQLVNYQERIVAIKDEFNSSITKVAIIDGPTDVQLVNINPENETDDISNLVLSGGILYFVATPTGGVSRLYSLNLDEDNPQPNDLAEINIMADMVALGDGCLAYTFDKYGSGSYYTHITKGVQYILYELYYGSSFALTEANSIDLMAVGNDLYQIEYNGTATNIWKHTLDESQFPVANIQLTIKDGSTLESIAGATVELSNGIYSYSAVSDANGIVTFMEIEGGTYYNYKVSSPNYLLYSEEYQWISQAPDNTKEILMQVGTVNSSAEFIIKDKGTNALISGANISISNGINSYNGTTDNTGTIVLNDISGDNYYTFTVTAPGYQGLTVEQQWISGISPNEFVLLLEEDAATGIGDTERYGIKVYPNPVSDVLQIHSESVITSVTIYALTGIIVKQLNSNQINSVGVGGLSTGIYIIVLTDNEGNQTTTKFTRK